MPRYAIRPALVPGALLAFVVGCADSANAPVASDAPIGPSATRARPAIGTGFPVTEGSLLRTVTNPVSGAEVKVLNGGFGSAIATAPGDPRRFYLMTDRGPNIDYIVGGVVLGKAFPAPGFNPQIGVFERRGNRLEKVDVITLKDESCRPLTGLPLPAGQTGSTGELAFNLDGTSIPLDPKGLDSEGLTILPDGSFWVSDEYGPFLTHFNRDGCTIERLGPGMSGRALPLALAKRRANRGMEGVTSILGGRFVVGIMQSPLDNPRAAGRASRLARILVLNPRTGATKQFAYLLESAALVNSEILALSPTRFLVLERDGDFPGANPAAVKKLYLIDVTGATDISDPANTATGLLVGGKTLEELTTGAVDPAAILRAAGIEPVAKSLAVDLLTTIPGYLHDKAEGIALVDPWTVAVSNDDDFGVVDGLGGLTQKLLPGTSTIDFGEVFFVRLPFGIRVSEELEDSEDLR